MNPALQCPDSSKQVVAVWGMPPACMNRLGGCQPLTRDCHLFDHRVFPRISETSQSQAFPTRPESMLGLIWRSVSIVPSLHLSKTDGTQPPDLELSLSTKAAEVY